MTTVGSQAVTPHLGSAAASSQMRSGSVVTSMPSPPLHCRSTNPGTIRSPAASTTGRLGGIGIGLAEHPVPDHDVLARPRAGPEHVGAAQDDAAHRRTVLGQHVTPPSCCLHAASLVVCGG